MDVRAGGFIGDKTQRLARSHQQPAAAHYDDFEGFAGGDRQRLHRFCAEMDHERGAEPHHGDCDRHCGTAGSDPGDHEFAALRQRADDGDAIRLASDCRMDALDCASAGGTSRQPSTTTHAARRNIGRVGVGV